MSKKSVYEKLDEIEKKELQFKREIRSKRQEIEKAKKEFNDPVKITTLERELDFIETRERLFHKNQTVYVTTSYEKYIAENGGYEY